jgi:hypothetical protein
VVLWVWWCGFLFLGGWGFVVVGWVGGWVFVGGGLLGCGVVDILIVVYFGGGIVVLGVMFLLC